MALLRGLAPRWNQAAEHRPAKARALAHHQLQKSCENRHQRKAEHRRLGSVVELAEAVEMALGIEEEGDAVAQETEPADPSQGAKGQPCCECCVHRSAPRYRDWSIAGLAVWASLV